jgi:hypothetical protein
MCCTICVCLLIVMRIKKRVAPELELCISESQREIFLKCDPITSCLKGLEWEMPASGSNREAVQLATRCSINKGSEEFLDHAQYMNRSHNDASALLARASVNIGRFLLVLAAFELISMPLTQYAWTWDHFLHGGMDFESSLLFLVVCLGLLLVLRHHCREAEDLCVPWSWLSLPSFCARNLVAMPGTGLILVFGREHRANSDLATYNLPLQI